MAKRTQQVTPNLMFQYVAIDLAGLYLELIIYLYFIIFKPSHTLKDIRIPYLKHDIVLIICSSTKFVDVKSCLFHPTLLSWVSALRYIHQFVACSAMKATKLSVVWNENAI